MDTYAGTLLTWTTLGENRNWMKSLFEKYEYKDKKYQSLKKYIFKTYLFFILNKKLKGRKERLLTNIFKYLRKRVFILRNKRGRKKIFRKRSLQNAGKLIGQTSSGGIDCCREQSQAPIRNSNTHPRGFSQMFLFEWKTPLKPLGGHDTAKLVP